MFFGYVFYYFTRKSFTFITPTLKQDFGLDNSQIGFLSSIWAMSYGLSKFASGIIGDRSNPRYFMSIGLILTGLCNIFFGLASSVFFFALFWAINGWFQGFGWPGCARLLTHWYSQSERGRWWSFWNTSHNIGGALIPFVVGIVAQYYGWRAAMFCPGVICILAGLWLMNRLRDTPQSLGLPVIERFKNDFPTMVSPSTEERELSVREILVEHVLQNPFIWLLGASYFFVYIIRMAMNDWTVLYLVESKNYSQMGAGGTVMWFEVGGFLGSLVAAWASDKIFQGRRGPINMLFCFLVSLALGVFWYFPYTSTFVDSLLLFAVGFFIFGPQMLIGVASADLSHKKAAATANGFVSWIGYAGAAVAGYPLGMITQNFGWEGFFAALVFCGAMSSLLLLPLWRIRSREDKVFASRKTAKPQPVEADVRRL